jgi:hypothetical protein
MVQKFVALTFDKLRDFKLCSCVRAMTPDCKISFRLFTREVEAAIGRRLNLPNKAKLTDAYRAGLEPHITAQWLSYKLQPLELGEVVRRIIAARRARQLSAPERPAYDRQLKLEPLMVARRREYLARLKIARAELAAN